MDRGNLVGQANIFQPYQPQLQEEVPGGIAPAQQDNQFKLPTDGIAVKRELTKKLFKNYSDLKNFMNAMAQQGIDPTMPDPSTDDGGQAYQVFLNMDANVRYAANELANEQKAMEQLRPYLWNNKARYAQGVDPQQAMISQDPSAVVSLEPTAATEQANLRLNTPTYTNQDERDFNKAYYDQAVRQIDRAVAAGQISAEQGEIQKQILQPNVAQTAYQQLVADEKHKNSGKTSKAAGELLKSIVNQTAGVWSPGTFQSKTIKGKRYNVSTRFSGERVGETQIMKRDPNGNYVPVTVPIIIKEWAKDPSTGSVTLYFVDDVMQPMQVDKGKGEQLAASLIANNPKWGGGAAVPELYNYMNEQGWSDETGTLIPDKLIDTPDVAKLSINNNPQLDAAIERKKIAVFSALDRAEDKIQNFRPSNDDKVIQIDVDDGGYFVKNWKNLGYTQANKPQKMSKEDVLTLLEENGLYNDINQKFSGASTNKTSVSPTSKLTPEQEERKRKALERLK